MPAPGFCRSCRAPIEFAPTEGGASIPLDPGDDQDGNIVMVGHKAHVLTLEEDVFYVGPRRITHFATCPNAAKHRKK